MAALEDCRQFLSALPGIDGGDLYFQRSASRSLSYSDGKVEEVSSSSSAGCSARLLKGRSSAFAVVSGVERGGAARALAEAARIASVKSGKVPAMNFPIDRVQAFFPENVDFFGETDRCLRAECGWIRQITLSCSANARRYVVVSPEGSRAGEVEHCSFAAEVIVERNGRLESGYDAFSLSGDAREFFRELSANNVARRALREALLNLEAVECPTGAMPVLLSDEAGGTIVHEACGHGMEADLAFEEQSSFAGKIGRQVAAEDVTVVDDASIPGLYGSFACDDEGTPSRRTVLVERGILKNYLTDKRCARLYGLPLTGNGRRSSYAGLPMPRMSNTFVAEGTREQGEMIQSVPRGIFVCRMGGGEVNTTTGEFVFDVTQGSLIEDGKITRPVKGASLIGRGIDALMGIRAVGKRLHMEPGMCEKEGQSLPVTDGQPSLLIDGLVVGGTAADR